MTDIDLQDVGLHGVYQPFPVMPGLDPGIHGSVGTGRISTTLRLGCCTAMDPRVKPEGDSVGCGRSTANGGPR